MTIILRLRSGRRIHGGTLYAMPGQPTTFQGESFTLSLSFSGLVFSILCEAFSDERKKFKGKDRL
jgi:hypothetical protein